MLYFIKDYFLQLYPTKSFYWKVFSHAFKFIPELNCVNKLVFYKVNRLMTNEPYFYKENQTLSPTIHVGPTNATEIKIAPLFSIIKHKHQTRYIRLQIQRC